MLKADYSLTNRKKEKEVPHRTAQNVPPVKQKNPFMVLNVTLICFLGECGVCICSSEKRATDVERFLRSLFCSLTQLIHTLFKTQGSTRVPKRFQKTFSIGKNIVGFCVEMSKFYVRKVYIETQIHLNCKYLRKSSKSLKAFIHLEGTLL